MCRRLIREHEPHAVMLANLRTILELLTPRERRQGFLVLLMVIGMAVLETAGVASVMPFLAVLGNPGVVEENPLLNQIYVGLGFTSMHSFLMVLGIGSFGLVVFGAVFRVLTGYAMHHFAEMRRHSIGARLLETYLRQPYEFFLGRHSAELAKGILSEADHLVRYVFRPGIEVMGYLIVALATVLLLVVVDPLLALLVGGVVGGAYGLIYLGIRGQVDRTGTDRAVANRERFTAANEALGGIKDIKLLGREQAYMTRFNGPSIRHARHKATNRVLSEVPKHLMEAAGFGGILAMALFLMATRGSLGNTLPVLGLYAFAGYRLLPAAQKVYAGFTELRFGLPAVQEVHTDLHCRERLAEIRRPPDNIIVPRQSIALRNVSFAYPAAPRPALIEIDLEIPVGATVGIVGGTGAGKTTLVDLLLGLLSPTHGRLEVDGEPITDENVRGWQAVIGYVPQSIFLTDTTVAENIALGIPPEAMDREAVMRAAHMAQVHDFILEELPNGYDTMVGERGVRLSGGQRQRIGIARALYHDPALLVFDEATSALDRATEAAVMESVQAMHGRKTVIMIAHRLSTVAECDCIHVFKGGRMLASGSYTDLLEGLSEFRRLAGAEA